jgi:hypothetical protein
MALWMSWLFLEAEVYAQAQHTGDMMSEAAPKVDSPVAGNDLLIARRRELPIVRGLSLPVFSRPQTRCRQAKARDRGASLD